jgi:hypothetical protein
MVQRAIILAVADCSGTTEIDWQLRTWPAPVSNRRTRFPRDRLTGLVDARRPGAQVRYDASTEPRIFAAIGNRPPGGHPTWTGSLLATTLGDVSSDQVWRTVRRRAINLRRRRSWYRGTDLEFAQKAASNSAGGMSPQALRSRRWIATRSWLRLGVGRRLRLLPKGWSLH